ncbi:MAG: retron system putative HNH endonuclease [Cyanobacteria bacterium P01_C01_bin.121]
MRWIQKKNEPHQLTEWRSRYNTDINFGYALLRQDSAVITALIATLLAEQGWLCAYTGIGIDANKCHLEHVKPQEHCTPDEAVTYGNLLACYPAPNQKGKIPYGAHQKDNWPGPEEQHLFVSPLEPNCDIRFRFRNTGKVEPCNKQDQAAQITIDKLGLNHRYLVGERKKRIQGTLGLKNDLSILKARQRLKTLKDQEGGKLEPFCFVLKQALENHIRRVEFIKASKTHTKSQKSQSKAKSKRGRK